MDAEGSQVSSDQRWLAGWLAGGALGTNSRVAQAWQLERMGSLQVQPPRP